jgi:hypothetical protein
VVGASRRNPIAWRSSAKARDRSSSTSEQSDRAPHTAPGTVGSPSAAVSAAPAEVLHGGPVAQEGVGPGLEAAGHAHRGAEPESAPGLLAATGRLQARGHVALDGIGGGELQVDHGRGGQGAVRLGELASRQQPPGAGPVQQLDGAQFVQGPDLPPAQAVALGDLPGLLEGGLGGGQVAQAGAAAHQLQGPAGDLRLAGGPGLVQGDPCQRLGLLGPVPAERDRGRQGVQPRPQPPVVTGEPPGLLDLLGGQVPAVGGDRRPARRA